MSRSVNSAASLKGKILTKKSSMKIGRVTIEQKNETEKLNPNSLRFTIGYIIKTHFGGSIKEACKKLEKFGGKYGERRADRKTKNITTTALSDILQDKTYITYWHLEIISNYLGIPTGVFLIISRLQSFLRYDNVDGINIFSLCLKNYSEKILNSKIDLTDDGKLGVALFCVAAAVSEFDELAKHEETKPMIFR